MWILGLPREIWLKQREMAQKKLSDHLHYCYRCFYCARLVTKLDILEARAANTAAVCTCGSKTVRITKAKVWEEFLLPRCWKLIAAIYTGWISPHPAPLSEEVQRAADRRGRELVRSFEREKTLQARRQLGL